MKMCRAVGVLVLSLASFVLITKGQSTPLFRCSFDDAGLFCGMEQDKTDAPDRQKKVPGGFDWTRRSGKTPTGNTGPDGGQSGSSHYIYAEMSDPQSRDDETRILTRELRYTGKVCVDFYYNMFGQDVGTLRVYRQLGGQNQPGNDLLRLVGQQGRDWIQKRLTVTLNDMRDRIGFGATKGKDYMGDIAIDSITITRGDCDSGGSNEGNLPFACNFDQSTICQMYQSTNDEFDWTYGTGKTPSTNTGPSSGRIGTHYMFIETSDPRRQGDRARLETPMFSYAGTVCVRFSYHMYGNSIGRLSVYTSGRGVNAPVMTYTGNKGNVWVDAAITMTLNSNERVGFLGVRGTDVEGDIAIDAIRITPGPCSGEETTRSTAVPTIPTTTTPPFQSMLPFRCGFETGLCRLVQSTNDQFDWTRQQGKTSSDGTGPDAARTGAYYIYTESSSPRYAGEKAYIATPPLGYTGEICVMFDYHMYGNAMGVLTVYTSGSGETRPVFQQRGNRGNNWQSASTDVFVRSTDSIIFVGEIGQAVTGDMAIDNLFIKQGRCTGGVTTTTRATTTSTSTQRPPSQELPFRCGFENNFCRFRQRTDDAFDWTKQNGPTATAETGPNQARAGQYYAFIETSSPRQQSDRALLETPQLGYTGEICVSFYYHMYGSDTGRLLVYASNSGMNRPAFSEGGDKGNQWREANVNIYVQSYESIIFMGERGREIRGDIAIDDVQITRGRCGSDFTTTTPRTTTSTTTGTVPQYGYYTCDIERDGQSERGCRVSQDINDQLDWLRYSGKTPSGSLHDRVIDNRKYQITGPASAVQGSYYLYLEASGRREGDMARMILIGDQFNRRGRSCLRFAYSMNGFHVGDLRVYEKGSAGKVYKWVLYGDQGQDWHSAAVDFNMDSVSEIGIEGRVGTEFSGDISIDNIRMTDGPCESTPSGMLWRCNFEISDKSATFCGMDQDSRDTPDFDWFLWRAGTPSEVTGPERAYNGDYYMYIEASKPRRAGDNARIYVPRLSYSGDVCVEFMYNMYGHHTGTLTLNTRRFTSDLRVRWTKSGEQGRDWREARVTIDNLSTDDVIGFNAIRGGEYSGDIAIDNIRIRAGRC